MAFTTPMTWPHNSLVRGVTMDREVRDNFRFLKGLDGAVLLDDVLGPGSFTTDEINAKTDRDGLIAYNTTTKRQMIRVNGVWQAVATDDVVTAALGGAPTNISWTGDGAGNLGQIIYTPSVGKKVVLVFAVADNRADHNVAVAWGPGDGVNLPDAGGSIHAAQTVRIDSEGKVRASGTSGMTGFNIRGQKYFGIVFLQSSL